MNPDMPEWLQNLSSQLRQGTVPPMRPPPTTPNYSQMTPQMTPEQWRIFLNRASSVPGVTLNQSGPNFSFEPRGLTAQTRPIFQEHFNSYQPANALEPQNSLWGDQRPGLDYERPQIGNYEGPGRYPSPALIPQQQQQQPSVNPIGILGRLARFGGPVGMGLGMAMQPTPTAPPSMDEAPRWAWPQGSYSP